MRFLKFFGVGALLSFFSGKANAWSPWPTTEEVTFYMNKIWRKNYQEFSRGFTDLVPKLEKRKSETVISATGVAGDGINKNKQDLHNENIRRATIPPPKMCSDKGFAKAFSFSQNEQRLKQRIKQTQIDKEAASVKPEDTVARQTFRAKKKNTSKVSHALTQPYGNPYTDEELTDFIMQTLGQADDMAFELRDNEVTKVSSQPYETARNAHLSRLSVVRQTLNKALHRRERRRDLFLPVWESAAQDDLPLLENLAKDEAISTWDLYQYEVQRLNTPGFKAAMDTYAHPAPVLKVLTHQMVTNTTFKKLQAELEEQHSVLLSIYALLLQEGNSSNVTNAYAAQ